MTEEQRQDPESPTPEENPTPEEVTSSKERRPIKIGSQREGAAPAKPNSGDAQKGWSSEALEAKTDGPDDANIPAEMAPIGPDADGNFPPPRVDRLSADLQAEIDAALDGVSLDAMLTGGAGGTQEPQIDERYRAHVVKVHREDVFFSLPGHYEGMASLRQFDETPEVGETMDVIVRKLNREEGIYELTVPGKSVNVSDWSDISEGDVVEVNVTGNNTGGLECEVNNLRGFIPVSQIDIYRVEDLEQYKGQRFACVITEANPERRNLVLSRRAMLEREKEESKQKLMATLAPGQTHEGVVRSIRDFGAFVDLGGVDGLVHVSKLSWDRVRHPSEVVEEGQRIKVTVEKIDDVTGKISLSYRDTLEHPWQSIGQKYVENTVTTGTVSKIMDFGAFVRLEPGVEGLVHISELAHHRVTRVDSIVREGEKVEVKVLSIDPDNQRMSLSIKAVQGPAPEAKGASSSKEEVEEPLREKATRSSNKPLKGGTNRPTGGEQFGLNW